ncbi:hypothetical protein LINPERHAP2_LOCUS44745 [Linum perenne]
MVAPTAAAGGSGHGSDSKTPLLGLRVGRRGEGRRTQVDCGNHLGFMAERNDWVWNQKAQGVVRTVLNAREAIEEWTKAQESREGRGACCDATVFEESGLVGGGIEFDRLGRKSALVQDVAYLHRRSRVPVKECEAWALLEGLRWDVEKQL